MSPARLATALFLLALAVLSPALGRRALVDWDEATYAQVAREMADDGHWLEPRYLDRPFFEKPPLFFWAIAGSFELFGRSEATARLVSVLAGAALVAVAFALAAAEGSRAAGVVAAFVLLSSGGFVHAARMAMTDMLLTLWLYLAYFGYLRARAGSSRGWHLTGLALAGALLTKSAAGLIGVGVIALVLLFDEDERRALRRRAFGSAAAVAVVLVAAWHLFMSVRHGEAFWEVYLGYQVVTRALHGIEEHGHGFAYYLPEIRRGFGAWALLLPAGLALDALRPPRRPRASRLILVAATLPLVAFSLARTKLPWYILPAYPALAIVVGRLADAGLASGRRWLRAFAVAATGLFLAAALPSVAGELRDERAPAVELAKRVECPSGDPCRPLAILGFDGGASWNTLASPRAVYYGHRPVREASDVAGVVAAVDAGADSILAPVSEIEPLVRRLPLALVAVDEPFALLSLAAAPAPLPAKFVRSPSAYRLFRDAATGEERLAAADGLRHPAAPKRPVGFVDRASLGAGHLRLEGWAADIERRRTGERIVVFEHGTGVFVGWPSVDRPDLARAFGVERLRESGFRFDVPSPAGARIAAEGLRVVLLLGDDEYLDLQLAGDARRELGLASGGFATLPRREAPSAPRALR